MYFQWILLLTLVQLLIIILFGSIPWMSIKRPDPYAISIMAGILFVITFIQTLISMKLWEKYDLFKRWHEAVMDQKVSVKKK